MSLDFLLAMEGAPAAAASSGGGGAAGGAPSPNKRTPLIKLWWPDGTFRTVRIFFNARSRVCVCERVCVVCVRRPMRA